MWCAHHPASLPALAAATRELRGTYTSTGSLSDPTSDLLGALGLSTRSGAQITEDTAFNVATVSACINILAQSIAMIPLKVYRKTAAGAASIDEIEIRRFLRKERAIREVTSDRARFRTAAAVLRAAQESRGLIHVLNDLAAKVISTFEVEPTPTIPAATPNEPHPFVAAPQEPEPPVLKVAPPTSAGQITTAQRPTVFTPRAQTAYGVAAAVIEPETIAIMDRAVPVAVTTKLPEIEAAPALPPAPIVETVTPVTPFVQTSLFEWDDSRPSPATPATKTKPVSAGHAATPRRKPVPAQSFFDLG